MEQIKIEEDLKTVKELEFYSKKTETVDDAAVNITEETAIDESPKKGPTSPVLKRNPFIKKKLSKFNCTSSDSQIIVKSRYFSGNSDNLEGTNNGDETDENMICNETAVQTKNDAVGETIEKAEITVNIHDENEKKTICDDVIEVKTEKTDINYGITIQQYHKISPKKVY